MESSNNFIKSYNHRLDENIHSPIDIHISKSIYKILPFVIECKITKYHIYLISFLVL